MKPIRILRASSSIKGFTLIELLVSLAIVAVLASMALPYVENSVTRKKESELRHGLRDIRGAIDAFYRDWREGRLPSTVELASLDGYPRSLEVLAEPIRLTDGTVRRYLRRVPRDPFAAPDVPASETWRLLGYRDSPDTLFWSGEDVYDVRSLQTGIALNGTRYDAW